MIAINAFAIFDTLSPLITETGFVEGTIDLEDLTPDHPLIYDVRVKAARHGDNLMRLATEWLIRAAPEDHVGALLTWNDPEDVIPLFTIAHELIWGPMPDGPPPLVQMFRMASDGQTAPTARWAACRQLLYGDIENDLPRLRELAIRPELVDGRGKHMTDIPCKDAESIWGHAAGAEN